MGTEEMMIYQTDANYTDDVGQTLLNWAAAFGSMEMVSESSVRSMRE